MLKYYKYPLKIWLTTSLLGTLSYLVCIVAGILVEEDAQIGNIHNLKSDNYFFMGVMALISLICSFPCFVILWVAYAKLIDHNVSRKKIRIMLCIFGAVISSICLLSVYYSIFNELGLKSILELLFPYNTVLIFSIWWFKISSKPA